MSVVSAFREVVARGAREGVVRREPLLVRTTSGQANTRAGSTKAPGESSYGLAADALGAWAASAGRNVTSSDRVSHAPESYKARGPPRARRFCSTSPVRSSLAAACTLRDDFEAGCFEGAREPEAALEGDTPHSELRSGQTGIVEQLAEPAVRRAR